MRALFAILFLLLCLIATRADDPLVIKDSEAVHYVGKNVEVRGLVVSVTTSPLGTTFINFGRKYPNQIFAGFIPMGSKSSASPAKSNFTKESRRSKSRPQIRSRLMQ
jgi:hypothetical protein